MNAEEKLNATIIEIANKYGINPELIKQKIDEAINIRAEEICNKFYTNTNIA